MAEVEEEAVDAGASPGSLDIQVEEQADKGTVRAVATGSVGLAAGAVPGRQPATALEIRADRGLDPEAVGTYWVVRPAKDELVVLDRFGDPVAEITGSTTSDVTQLAQLVERHTRYRGPITMRPSVWVIDGAQLIELSSGDVVASAQALRDTDRKQLFVVGRAA